MSTTVADVAAFILDNSRPMTTMKLQNWFITRRPNPFVEQDKPLVDTEFFAWINGPVSKELFNFHRGLSMIRRRDLNAPNVQTPTPEKQQIILDVLTYMGDYSANQLSERTHRESPWINTRKGLGPTELGNKPITQEAMRSFYKNNPVHIF